MVLWCWATGLGLYTTGWCSSSGAALASGRKTHSAKSSGHTLPRTPCLQAGTGLTLAHTHALTPAQRHVLPAHPSRADVHTTAHTYANPRSHAPPAGARPPHTPTHAGTHSTRAHPGPQVPGSPVSTGSHLCFSVATPSGVRSRVAGPHQPGDRRSPRFWAVRWRPRAQALSGPAAPAGQGVSLGPSGAPSILSSETDVCCPLRCPQQHAPGPHGESPRAHVCPGGAQGSGPTRALWPRDGYVGEPGLPRWGVCSRKPLCTHAWAPSTRTPRDFCLTHAGSPLGQWFRLSSGTPGAPAPPPHPGAAPVSPALAWTLPGRCHPGELRWGSTRPAECLPAQRTSRSAAA